MNILSVQERIPEFRALLLRHFGREQAAMTERLTQGLEEDLKEIASRSAAQEKLAQSVSGLPEPDLSLTGAMLWAAIAAKRAGIYPYYLTAAAALALQAETDGAEAAVLDRDALLARLGKCFSDAYPLHNEPELMHLIRRHLENLRSGAPILELPEKYARIKKAYELGFLYEGTYRGCAQCVLAAIFTATGRSEPAVFRAAGAMGGGSAQCGDGACGGYNGGIMATGLYVGRRLEHIDGDQAEKDQANAICQALHDHFIETYGSVTCRDIHQQIFDRSFLLRIPDERTAFQNAGSYFDKCTAVVGISSAWVMEQLIGNGYV